MSLCVAPCVNGCSMLFYVPHAHTHTGGTSGSQGRCGLIHVKEEKHSPHWDKSAQRAPHGEGGLPRSELRCVTFVLLPDLFLPRLLGDKEWDSLEAAYPLTS